MAGFCRKGHIKQLKWEGYSKERELREASFRAAGSAPCARHVATAKQRMWCRQGWRVLAFPWQVDVGRGGACAYVRHSATNWRARSFRVTQERGHAGWRCS